MRQYNLCINNNAYEVVIKEVTEEDITAEVNGEEFVVKIQDIKDLSKASSVSPFQPAVADSQPTQTEAASSSGPSVATPEGSGEGICSPMPGQIIGVYVSKGDKVLAGQKVMVLEAMKLENTITADREGTVVNVFVKEGDIVNQNQSLLVIG